MRRGDPVQARLDALVARHGLAPTVRDGLASLLDRFAESGSPTTVRAPEEAVDVHVADALVALEVSEVRAAGALADLGSGAGSPGLVLALALPSTHVVLVESQRRKCAFLRAAAASTSAANVEVACTRIETWEAGAGRQDVVTVRAVAALSVLCEYAAPLLRVGGVLVAWKGDVGAEERADGQAAARRLGLEPLPVLAVTPYPASARRTLHGYRKVGETPARFPRRPGMAAKRPLRAAGKP